MANFIVTYDLNNPHPTHAEMDRHLRALGAGFLTARTLESTWYVAGPTNPPALRDYVASILDVDQHSRADDLLLVAETGYVAWTKLLIDDGAFKRTFETSPAALAA